MTEATLSHDDIQAMLDDSPFIHSLGLKVESLNQATLEITMRMALQPHLERAAGTGQFHGGAIASLVDVAGDFAVAMAVGGVVPTINFRVDFLRPSTGDHLLATARARRIGRTVGVVDIDIEDPLGRLCAVGRGTYSTITG